MTDKITLTQLSSLENETTAINQINGNSVTIVAGFDNTLSRNGTSPNQMGASLDMNSFQILNLPSPGTINSPARLIDVTTNPTISVPPTGTSGSTVPYLNGNNTWSGTNTYTSTTTFNGTVTLPVSSVFTGDSGSGGTIGIVPAPTSGQGASDAVLKASGSFGVVGFTNTRLAKTGAYTAVNGDKGKTIALSGGTFYTLTLSSPSGYDADYVITIVNEDTGRAKTISPSGMTSFFLWPGQTCMFVNQNNTWRTIGKSGKWKLTAGIQLNIDPTNGNDSNDGLSTGSGNALATIQAAVNIVKNQLDIGSFGVTVQCVTGTYAPVSISFPIPQGQLVIKGDTTTPSNCLITGTNNNIFVVTGSGSNATITGFKLTNSGAGSLIYCSDWATVSFGIMEFGASAQDHLEAADGGFITCLAGNTYTVSGGGSSHWHAHGVSHIQVSAVTITITGTPAFSGYWAGVATGLIECQSDTFTGSATGPRYLIHYNGTILTAAGAPTTYLPGSTGGTADGASGGYIV